jgi:hypothetical protein
MPIVRLLSSISFLLALCLCWAGPAEDLSQALDRAATKDQVRQALKSYGKALAPDELARLEVRLNSGEDFRQVRDSVPALLAKAEAAEGWVSGKVAKPSTEAKKILSSPEFRDSGATTTRNWFARSLSNLGETLANWLDGLLRSQNRTSDLNLPSLGIGPSIIRGVIIVLALGLVGGLIYFLARWKWAPKSVKKGGGGLLDEDEPDRTADEWLDMADSLEAEGKHREAVRCLYLACLVRLDENKVAAFMRGQTNWEHLRRIHASKHRPSNWEFRSATQRFDLVWYGKVVQGSADTIWFRTYYQDLMARLKTKAEAA